MRILNGTVYDSEDIRELVVAIHKQCCVRKDEQTSKELTAVASVGHTLNTSNPYFQKTPLPTELRIATCNPRTESSNLTSLTNKRSSSPRIGIVTPDRLPIVAMEYLAKCAAGESVVAPSLLIEELITTVSELFNGDLLDIDYDDLTDLHQISIRMEVLKEDKAAVKKATNLVNLRLAETELSTVSVSIDSLVERLNKKRKQQTRLINRVKKLEKALGNKV